MLILGGQFDTNGLRQFSNRGSLSGAIIGGLIFGVGMALSRACSGRMLVLTGGGNLRALLTGLVFAAFGVHAWIGGAYETRTVGAMTLRTLLWAGIAATAHRVLRQLI